MKSTGRNIALRHRRHVVLFSLFFRSGRAGAGIYIRVHAQRRVQRRKNRGATHSEARAAAAPRNFRQTSFHVRRGREREGEAFVFAFFYDYSALVPVFFCFFVFAGTAAAGVAPFLFLFFARFIFVPVRRVCKGGQVGGRE